MTDKEQIIIDGVDVSGCRYFLKDTEGQDYNTDEFIKGCCEAKGSCIGYDFAGYGLCRGDKDCYFKQLARKTQECEQIKEKYEALKLENQEGYEIVAELKHECEELKTEKEVIKKYLGISDKSIMQRLEELTEYKLKRQLEYIKIGEKRDRYRKALDEIEKIVKINCEEICGRKFEDCNDFLCSSKNILDIINKAKGKAND